METANIQEKTVTGLTGSLQSLPPATLCDIRITPLGGDRVRIEMPLARLQEYRFACTPARFSWAQAKSHVVVDLQSFTVEQKAERGVFSLEIAQNTPVQSLLCELAREKSNPVREIFLTRSLRALQGLRTLDEADLAVAAQAPTDCSVLATALGAEEVLAGLRVHDPLAGARLRGIGAKQRLLDAEGGTVASAEAARMLKVSRQAVDKRRNEGKLLGVELGRKGYHYPVWQFDLPGLDVVLEALGDRDPWQKISFFLNSSALLRDRTPLEALRGGKVELDEVVRAAVSYGEQGG